MPLIFQERAGSLRVVRMVGDIETMIASVEHAFIDADASKVSASNPQGTTVWKPLPRAECKIHSAVGPLAVADIEEILAHLPA
jgi:hypothetical protein